MSEEHTAKTIGSEDDDIVVTNLRKEFDDIVAVREVDLRVQQGEMLVLLGPSGCGKSTMLRMIAGLEIPTDGQIILNNDYITEDSPQERDISMVFQSYALYPHKTVKQNLKFPLNKADIPDHKREYKIDEVAEILEITDLLDRKPDQLSGGQRQRVAIGRAIVREPKVFLMDEPLSNLDARLRVQTRAEIRDLQQRLETTTVYVTHDQEEAMSIADRLAIMNDGLVEQVGTPKDVYENPQNKFVAGFLGEPEMNIIDINQSRKDPTIFDKDPVPLKPLFGNRTVPESAASLGIRPNDIYLDSTTENQQLNSQVDLSSSAIKCSFELIDPLGHKYELSVSKGSETIVVMTEKQPTTDLGSRIKLRIDQKQIYWFNEQGRLIN